MNLLPRAKAGFTTALVAAFLAQPFAALAQQAASAPIAAVIQPLEPKQILTLAPKSSPAVTRHMLSVEAAPNLTHAQKLALIQQHIKYVFVLFQENRSFDFYFGSYPGANNLYSQSPANTPGFNQPFVTTSGQLTTIQPFKIPASIVDVTGRTIPLYPADTASVNHGHVPMDTKLNFDSNFNARNDRYSLVEEGVTLNPTTGLPNSRPSLARAQFGELVMAHVDCDTVPFLWNYADRFTLFDNFFDTVIGPSTPNAIAMIAGQSGETQWVKHPALGANYTHTNAYLPVTADPQPFWGSALDVFTPPGQKQPTESGAPGTTNPASNLTFASLPLSFMGRDIQSTIANDLNPAFDLLDVQADIVRIAGDNNKPVNWAWFQEGYNHESTDPAGTTTNATYIAHHNGPQYFGYEANNPVETRAHLKGLGDFFTAVSAKALPSSGVFYVRGGYGNLDGLVPQDPDPATRANYTGNDDHPAYSDAQISEALLADEINAIAASPYWPESAIIITYDETDGLYDHTQPKIRSFDALGNALDQGPRIPAIVISPYSVVHGVSHERTEHSSIIKFIDELFNLTPLADLPDEALARKQGLSKFGQLNLGPADAKVPGVGDMFTAFDNARLKGTAPPLEAQYAVIPRAQVLSLPHFGGQGCRVLQITPDDALLPNPVPADFNPRPDINPGNPAAGGWRY